jgi:hypothetical protein
MIEQGIVALLTANAPLMALIDPHIFPVYLPETAILPAVSYQVITRSRDYTLTSQATSEALVQFDFWAEQYSQAKAIQQALRNVLELYAGTLTDGTRVMGAFLSNCIDMPLTDDQTYHVVSEFTFQYVEP